ncbi:hypothetical protein FHL15_003329 [Xylaria flabelliformis]|uniref:Uncharacterized protein n=1 Tax=Xylaria flabelliformis TaxID=2512241 RepID=A0A553I6E6_9PEZI|nr:hypothetical protein FHL15_003329 [Xylaria flabelliformis]
MSQLPEGTLGDAVGVLIFTFICLITNILLLWLFWINSERFSYIALVGYFALLCTTSSIIQQIYNYSLWDDLAWAQLRYIKANYKNADVIFNNGNFGFMRVLAIIRLLQTPAVQSSFTAYMFVANVQSVTSCAVSIILLSIVIRQYVMSKLAWRRVQTTGESANFWSRLRNSSSSNSSKDQSAISPTVSPVFVAQGTIFDDNWVVVRLSIAVVLISAFIVANIVTHLPQADDVARDAKAEAPDLGPERARSNIIGYIFGVTPGLAIWIVFGLTRDFRHIMYETFVPRSWRRRGSGPAQPLETSWDAALDRQHTYLSGVSVDTRIQLDDLNAGAKKRSLPDRTDAPLLVSTPTPKPTPSDKSVSRVEEISIGQKIYLGDANRVHASFLAIPSNVTANQ